MNTAIKVRKLVRVSSVARKWEEEHEEDFSHERFFCMYVCIYLHVIRLIIFHKHFAESALDESAKKVLLHRSLEKHLVLLSTACRDGGGCHVGELFKLNDHWEKRRTEKEGVVSDKQSIIYKNHLKLEEIKLEQRAYFWEVNEAVLKKSGDLLLLWVAIYISGVAKLLLENDEPLSRWQCYQMDSGKKSYHS